MNPSTNARDSGTVPRVLLIDLDNCPKEIAELTRTASHYDLIIASHGRQEPRVPLGIAAVLGELIATGRIEIWAMPGGKNAADFGLTFVAGRLSGQVAAGTHFDIASRDKDLQHAVDLLRRSGYSATRVDSSEVKASPRSDHPEVSEAAGGLARSLSGRGAKSRPQSKKALEAASKARGKTPEEGLKGLRELIGRGAIKVPASGKPIYEGELLARLALAAQKKKQKTEPLPIQKLVAKRPKPKKRDESQLALFDFNDEPEIPF